MKLLIFVLLIFSFHLSKGQISLCGSKNPFPDKILTIQEEIGLKNKMDSLDIEKVKISKSILKISHRTTYGKPLDSIYFFWGELKKLQIELLKLSRNAFTDTSSKYKLLFIEEYSYKIYPYGNTSNYYNISQFDSVINGREFYKNEKQLFPRSYSYNNQFLIVEECHQYTGNTSWHDRKVYYFEKVED